MLPKYKRLNLKTDFKAVVRGTRVETTRFKLFFIRRKTSFIHQNTGIAKVGISMSKQDFKKATLRNKARRLASSAVEKIYNDLPAGMNLIIMPKGQVLESGKQELVNELSEALIKRWQK